MLLNTALTLLLVFAGETWTSHTFLVSESLFRCGRGLETAKNVFPERAMRKRKNGSNRDIGINCHSRGIAKNVTVRIGGVSDFHEMVSCPSQVQCDRRWFLLQSAVAVAVSTGWGEGANAAFLNRKNSRTNTSSGDSTSLQKMEAVPSYFQAKTMKVEDYMLELLPVKNQVFLKLRFFLDSVLPEQKRQQDAGGDALSTEPAESPADETTQIDDEKAWKRITKKCEAALEYLGNNQQRLEPSFDLEDEDTIRQILRNERFEELLESLRRDLDLMVRLSLLYEKEKMYKVQRRAKITLAEMGELILAEFPYDVPTDGSFANLPRLLGRAKVTFTIVRQRTTATWKTLGRGGGQFNLGNVTIVADGYAAPLTAGNFVDLAIRNFYTGLPVKFVKKRWAATARLESEQTRLSGTTSTAKAIERELTSIPEKLGQIVGLDVIEEETSGGSSTSSVTPILGSFQEGFIDPLTAKPRRIPLELVKINKPSPSIGGRNFLYWVDGANRSASAAIVDKEKASENKYAKPILSFNIPGLIALNHPDRNPNGGSSEFFSLPEKDIISRERVEEIDGNYAPFGYVVGGLDILRNIEPGDQISATFVDEWGANNLVKIRGSVFDMRGDESDEDEDESESD